MPVTSVTKDPQARTMTVTAEFDAPVERVWQIWSDPRQLERWWGPPTYPATVLHHDLTPGGTVTYLMTGPNGEKHHGWWRVAAVAAPRRLEFEDGFGDDPDHPAAGLPTMTVVVTLDDRTGGGTLMQVVSTFPSAEAMEQILAMGAEEGMRESMGQIDALLAG